MKVGISQKVLKEALEKGAIAAISDEAQQDTSNLSLIIKSLKITVDKKFTIESTTNFISVKYSIDATEENGIIVKEPGSIVIPAKELINWVNVQGGEATINIVLSKLATPETINMLEDIGVSDSDTDSFAIKKIGTVKLSSKDDEKTKGKWELDCYDSSQLTPIDFKKRGSKHFDIDTKEFTEALSKVSFASLPRDYEHILDSVSIQIYNKGVYFVTTDTKRCALYRVPNEAIKNIDSKKSLLITTSLMEQVAKISNKETHLEVYYDDEENKVFISQPNLDVRLTTISKKDIEKFPNIKFLLEKDYELLTEASSHSLNKVLITSAIVNNSSALFIFEKGKDELIVRAISDDNKYKPSISQTNISKPTKDIKIVWGVTHLIEGLKIIKSDNVKLYISDNLKSVKVVGGDSDNFTYFAMAINNPKYKTNE